MTGKDKAARVEQVLAGVWHLTKGYRLGNQLALCGVAFNYVTQVDLETDMITSGQELGMPVCPGCAEERDKVTLAPDRVRRKR